MLALVTSQILAHGMTRPLREMTAAARAMARGDYTRRIRATARDEVGELAHAFNQMAADLDAADQQRRELIANVSHELRTPITALNGVLENLVDGVAEPDPATLRTALAQTERLGLLVTELLDLSRIDAGAFPLDLEEFDLELLLAEVAAEAEVMAAAVGRGVRFAVDVEPPGASVVADRGRLHQVVLNLLDNAARHGPAGGKVHVGARSPRGRRRDRGPRRGPRHPGRGTRPGLRTLHPRRAGRGRRHRPRPGHRPVGGRPARRQHRRRRAGGTATRRTRRLPHPRGTAHSMSPA